MRDKYEITVELEGKEFTYKKYKTIVDICNEFGMKRRAIEFIINGRTKRPQNKFLRYCKIKKIQTT